MALLALALALAAPPARAQVCGDGILDAGEQCDTGALLGTGCCLLGCVLAPLGFECRPAEGSCDLPEVCDGVSAQCPVNQFRPPQVCRPAAGPCDLEESCSGVGPACPADKLAPPTTTCRFPATACDLPELCTGTSLDCPQDTGEPDADGDGVCDALDLCPSVPDPEQRDADGDGLGDACDPCTNPSGNELVGPRVAMSKLSAPPDDDRMKLKATFKVPLDPEIDPPKKGLRLVLSGPLGVVFDAVIPGGSFDTSTRVGWRPDGEGRWWYKNVSQKVPRISGIKRLTLRQDPTAPSTVRLVAWSRGGDMRGAVGQPSLRLSVVLDSPVAASGQCAEAEFAAAGDASNCRLLNTGRRLECRLRR